MRLLKAFLFVFVAGLFLAVAEPANAQVSVGVNIGPAPVCVYGYYDYAPYGCAPYGYYGPEWFVGGGFIGAGPWFHGPRGFHGYVNNRYDVNHGYRGRMPGRNEHYRAPARNFHGNEQRDGQGHAFHGGGGRR
jgi:hypothetical protein